VSYTTTDTYPNLVQAFQQLDTDEQLALFWYIYTEMGDSITPAAPGASTVSTNVADSLFEQVKAMSREEQLQVQRDLIERKNSLISREYGAFSETTKLLFWYLLAQGMSNNTIVPMPPDYDLTPEAENLFSQIKRLEFQQQITVFRDYVAPMGVDPATAEHDPETGL